MLLKRVVNREANISLLKAKMIMALEEFNQDVEYVKRITPETLTASYGSSSPEAFYNHISSYYGGEVLSRYFTYFRDYTDAKFMTYYMQSKSGQKQVKHSMEQYMGNITLASSDLHEIKKIISEKTMKMPEDADTLNNWLHHSLGFIYKERKKDLFDVINQSGINQGIELETGTVTLSANITEERVFDIKKSKIPFGKIMNSMWNITDREKCGYFIHSGDHIFYDLISYFQDREIEEIKDELCGDSAFSKKYIEKSILTEPNTHSFKLVESMSRGRRLEEVTVPSMVIPSDKLRMAKAGIDIVVNYLRGKVHYKSLEDLKEAVILAEQNANKNKDAYTPLTPQAGNRKVASDVVFQNYITAIHDSEYLFSSLAEMGISSFALDYRGLLSRGLSRKYDNLLDYINGFEYTYEATKSSIVTGFHGNIVDSLVDEMSEQLARDKGQSITLHIPLQELIDSFYVTDNVVEKIDYNELGQFLPKTSFLFNTIPTQLFKVMEKELETYINYDEQVDSVKYASYNPAFRKISEMHMQEELEEYVPGNIAKTIVSSFNKREDDNLFSAMRAVEFGNQILADISELFEKMKNTTTDIMLISVLQENQTLIDFMNEPNRVTLSRYYRDTRKYYSFMKDIETCENDILALYNSWILYSSPDALEKVKATREYVYTIPEFREIVNKIKNRIEERYPGLFVTGTVSSKDAEVINIIRSELANFSINTGTVHKIQGWDNKNQLPPPIARTNVYKEYGIQDGTGKVVAILEIRVDNKAIIHPKEGN